MIIETENVEQRLRLDLPSHHDASFQYRLKAANHAAHGPSTGFFTRIEEGLMDKRIAVRISTVDNGKTDILNSGRENGRNQHDHSDWHARVSTGGQDLSL